MDMTLTSKATAERLPYFSMVELANAYRAGATSPVEVTRIILDRIAAFDPLLKSYTTVLAERALAKAEAAQAEMARGFWRGPLHGVPIAVKDLCYTSYAPTSAGMHIHRDFIPSFNATVVERLERAGAVMLGKLTMTEGAFSGHHPKMRTPVNPVSPVSWTGASSSGSGAATAAGLCYGSLGSDTGGSIRFPSAACGITGLKPTWGRVSRYGVFPLSESLDHIGPMTRSAADAAAMLAAIAGADANDPTTLPAPVPDYLGLLVGIRGMKIGLDETYVREGLHPEVAKAFDAALAALVDLGVEIVPVRLPDMDATLDGWNTLCSLETAIAHEATFPAQAAEYGPELGGWIERGLKVTAFDAGKAMQQRLNLTGAVKKIFADVDLLVVPAIPMRLPTLKQWVEMVSGGAAADFSAALRFTAPFDMTGSPTISLPCGFDGTGAPIGFQLIGPHLSEDVLLRAGHAYQQVTDWHSWHPDLPVLKAAQPIAAE